MVVVKRVRRQINRTKHKHECWELKLADFPKVHPRLSRFVRGMVAKIVMMAMVAIVVAQGNHSNTVFAETNPTAHVSFWGPPTCQHSLLSATFPGKGVVNVPGLCLGCQLAHVLHFASPFSTGLPSC